MIDPTLESLQLLIEANDRRLNDLMKERELRDQQRHDASREALHAALGCAKEAITKAEAAYEKRFDNTNQWKQTFSELSGKMVTRMEYSSAYEALKDKIDEVSGRIGNRGKVYRYWCQSRCRHGGCCTVDLYDVWSDKLNAIDAGNGPSINASGTSMTKAVRILQHNNGIHGRLDLTSADPVVRVSCIRD